MKNDCSIIKDLLPLYAEDMVSEETAEYVKRHLCDCAECQKELASLKGGEEIEKEEKKPEKAIDTSKPFKRIMKKMNRQLYSLGYALIIFFVFLGFGWTAGEHMLYNSLIMPIVGVFGYCVFKWKAIYKVPILLLAINVIVCIFKLIELDFYSAVMWTLIYTGFVFVGIAIAFLLHYGFRKENK